MSSSQSPSCAPRFEPRGGPKSAPPPICEFGRHASQQRFRIWAQTQSDTLTGAVTARACCSCRRTEHENFTRICVLVARVRRASLHHVLSAPSSGNPAPSALDAKRRESDIAHYATTGLRNAPAAVASLNAVLRSFDACLRVGGLDGALTVPPTFHTVCVVQFAQILRGHGITRLFADGTDCRCGHSRSCRVRLRC